MKHRKLRAILYTLYAAFLIFASLAAAVGLLNWHYSECWGNFLANARSGFTDCPGVFPAYRSAALALLALSGALLFNRILRRLGFFWALRIRIGRLRFTAGSLEPAEKRKTTFIRTVSLLLAVLSCALCGSSIWKERTPQNLWRGDTVVTHALGAVNGFIYTNSREAFEYWHAQGNRTFEVDIQLTRDGQAVLAHNNVPMNYQEFMSGTAMGRTVDDNRTTLTTPCTPMSFADLCLLMKEHPDIWIITDTKYTDPEAIRKEFRAMLDSAASADALEVFDRLVVQLYNEDMYEIVSELYPFKSYIFTMYQRWDGSPLQELIDICRWCRAHGGVALCMSKRIYTDKAQAIAQRYGLDVYVHTVNDGGVARDNLARGARGVYTDVIGRADLGA